MIAKPRVALVVAVARNGVIGADGGLPWRISGDLKRFKALTMGKPVIMGRKTWESLPKKPLVGRTNIVLSKDGSFEAKGALVCEDFSEAVQIAREQAEEDGQAEVCVIGGASLFGGSGTVIGTVIGALIIAVIQYGLVFINVEPFWQFVAVGIVIIVSVLIDQSRTRLTGEVKDGD